MAKKPKVEPVNPRGRTGPGRSSETPFEAYVGKWSLLNNYGGLTPIEIQGVCEGGWMLTTTLPISVCVERHGDTSLWRPAMSRGQVNPEQLVGVFESEADARKVAEAICRHKAHFAAEKARVKLEEALAYESLMRGLQHLDTGKWLSGHFAYSTVPDAERDYQKELYKELKLKFEGGGAR